MHDLQACLFKYNTVAAFHIYAECGEDAVFAQVKGRLEAMHKIVMEITLLIMENHGKIMELFLNFCGNPDLYILFACSAGHFQVSHIDCVSGEEAEEFVEDDTTHG